ncbi:alpha/beta hydrolase family protein [Kineococcus terrestris]|uniref:alpha/beta hydrolase family protein n=1 Tax=Kineococcus terrestris TaxID=2044856 RepID=UPI0034DB0289
MPTPVPDRRLVAIEPLLVPTTGRGTDLHVKVTAPADGHDLPVLVFSHGNAWSMDGYGPLAARWAAAGFVVVQPTHLDARRYGLGVDDPRFPGIWRTRIADLHAVLDHLGDLLDQVPGLSGRADRARVALAGHSWGGQSAGALLGARVLPPAGDPEEDFRHPAVRAGALIAAPGTGESLTAFAHEHLPFMRPDFSTLTTPTLVVAGGRDDSALSTRGPDWFTDAHVLSPAPTRLLTIAEGEHTLGGLAGEAVRETTDEDPERVALVADAVAAYLLDVLTGDGTAWREVEERARRSRVEGGSGVFDVETSPVPAVSRW